MKYVYGIVIPLISIVSRSLSSYPETFDNKAPNFTEIGTSLGYKVNEYDVVTQDGYILQLFHIPGDKNRPVLLMHGVIDSADTFIIRGNSSLAIVLANAGFDVWIGNNRGNRYSRRHIYLDPNIDEEFWDFSFHEAGFYDLPAMIDFVLSRSASASLSAVGHSQGNTIFLVLGAKRPEYNDKIKVLVSLSPICFLNNLNNRIYEVMRATPTIAKLFLTIGDNEIFGDETLVSRLFKTICGPKYSYILCAHGLIFELAGSDPDELEPDFYPTVIAHYPTGTSVKNAIHVAQVGLRKSFAEYDYESQNVNIYNSSVPPVYDLSRVTMRVALVAGRNDQISTLKDVDLLRNKLPNVVEYVVVKHQKFNHLDAVWGRNMRLYLFPTILNILSKYN